MKKKDVKKVMKKNQSDLQEIERLFQNCLRLRMEVFTHQECQFVCVLARCWHTSGARPVVLQMSGIKKTE